MDGRSIAALPRDFVSLRAMTDRPACCAHAVRELEGGAERWLRRVGGLRGRRNVFWLDSAAVGPRLGRYSFAGAEPWAIARAQAGRFEVEGYRQGPTTLDPSGVGDALEAARSLMPPAPSGQHAAPVPFVGGVVAVLGYESMPASARAAVPQEAASIADATLFGVDRLYAFDHLEGRAWAIALGVGPDLEQAERSAGEAASALAEEDPDGDPPVGRPGRGPVTGADGDRSGAVSSGFDEKSHAAAVRAVQERIIAGDVYQACLTHRVEVPYAGDAWQLHAALRERNPAPFAAYLELPDATVVGSSPERFLAAKPDGWLESRPIKGTRPRSADTAQDRALREELRHSEKDRAENLMIVDLVRNDLGRVAELGSVHVPELFHVEAHPSVHQLVSTIKARLADEHDVFDAVRAAFPPGSMTGAPKRAAMELLRALEQGRRGPYAGALGYFDARGGADLSVVIRTIILAGGTARLHTGGGIVYDSVAPEEWAEAEDKVRALLETIAAVADPEDARP